MVGTLVLITTEDPGFPQWPSQGAGRVHRPAALREACALGRLTAVTACPTECGPGTEGTLKDAAPTYWNGREHAPSPTPMQTSSFSFLFFSCDFFFGGEQVGMGRNRGKYKTVVARKAGRQRGGRAVTLCVGRGAGSRRSPPCWGSPPGGQAWRWTCSFPTERNLWFHHGSQWKIWFALQEV